ncbi:MAG: DUF3025 domain-containing protein [Ramlibacter sp.]
MAAASAAGLPLAQALNAQGGAPVRFTGPDALPQGHAYETHIFATRTCPTRENLHDFFNGLAWLNFPLAKSRLNELQAREIAQRGIGGVRGPVRDAITLFDENGALLDAPEPLWHALRARDWQRLFVALRPLWTQARVLVVGHALLEKLAQPRKALTAHVWDSPCSLTSPTDADEWLANQLTAERLRAKPFTPLPVLGIPGWCAGNDDLSFYDDPRVFRTPPQRT